MIFSLLTNSIYLPPGARMLYKNLPRNVGLKRLTLHKSATGPNVNYILLVECSHFLDNINQVVAKISRKIVNSLLSGCQSSPSATSQDMRLHRNLPNRRVVLTLSTWERDAPPHPTEPQPKPRSLPTVRASATPRTPRSWACWHQEVWEWWIFRLPLQVLANCAYSDTDVSNFQN